MATVAVIGLGNIGGGVAANLVAAGHRVQVADLDTSRVTDLVQTGAVACDSATQAVEGAEATFTSLPGPAQITTVGNEILPAMATGSSWIELSTNDIATAQALHAQAQTLDIAYLDAPVSGGPEGAAAGTLSIFVGGQGDHVDAVRPLLGAIGTKVDHVGPTGAGIAAKIAQVTLCYTQTVTLIEAMLLGVKAGVEPHLMLDIIQNSAGGSYVADTYGPEILAGTYDASFPISHAAKDMRLATELAASVGADLPFMAEVAALYADTESAYGPTAAHLLAAQLRERANDLVLHEQLGTNQ